MGLFSIFNRDNQQNKAVTNTVLPDIPEETFIEKNTTQKETVTEKAAVGLTLLYDFLDKNYESKGYDDALVNPDASHLEQNILALKNDLERCIRRVKTYYEDAVREINFHISSRTRSGMIDTVEELTMKKQTAESHIEQVVKIQEEAKSNDGVGYGIVISYIRGFKNGLAAISHHTILKKNF